ncbi:peptidylprolyl isomerase [Paracoccus sanguinis]|uniref:peptidylprolyl isomerase n=1 Tax=Paracoccus sanguinis TaxID=1545044 RepID=UPI00051FDF24|nr:peptidylprolyl isomerase [Paracoccus sanguinis]KGJ12951.1 peptidylprolyl isomerase [Paracoccus sanguinis]
MQIRNRATAAPATGTPTATTVVATVNGEAITLGQMIAMKEGMQHGAADVPDTALWDMMLDQMISQTAVAQVAAQSLTPRDTAIIELDRRAYLSGAALERIAGAEPTEAELRAAYDAAFGADKTPKEEYSASHILVKTEEEAKAIADELAKGADFGKLAEEKSRDNSGANKGDLGWFTPDMMVKPFADAVVALKKGEVSAPVQSQFGWHVIKLNDTRTQAAPEFDAIRDQLAMQVGRQKVEAEIQKQVTAARIEKVPGLDAGLLNKTDLLDK